MSESNAQVEQGEQQEQQEEKPQGKTPEQLQQELTASTQQVVEARMHAQLMSDPEISQILRARAAKKKIKIVEDDGGYKPAGSIADEVAPSPENEPDLEKMTNTELFKHLAATQAKNTEKILTKMLAPVSQQIGQLEQLTTAQLNERSRQEVDQVRKQYPDFDKHRDSMLTLVGQNPNLNAKQLYVLAKAQAGEPVVEARQMSSERPGSVTTRPPARQTRKTPPRPGMLGLQDIIREATGHLELSEHALGEESVEVGD